MNNRKIFDRRSLFLIGLFVVFISSALADSALRNIDGQITAYFPSEPKFNGKANVGTYELISYEYTDEENIVVYTATYQSESSDFDGQDDKDIVRDYARGQAIVVSGDLVSFEYVNIGDASAKFSTEFEYEGLIVRKFAITVLNNGRLKQWSVQDILGVSTADAKDIFNIYVGSARLQ